MAGKKSRTITHYKDIQPYLTKDGSIIRELMHPAIHGKRKTSLAEATLAPGSITDLHVHHISEEIYHVTQGKGTMTRGNEVFSIEVGDTVCINPGLPHRVENTGELPLKILCCCTPPYSHDDTKIVAEMA